MNPIEQLPNNVKIPMTRRYPKLPEKVLRREAKISMQLINAWDIEHNPKKVLEIYLREAPKLSDERYWELMRTVWIVCGNNEIAPIFRKLMQSPRKQKFYFSTPEEMKRLREFDFIKIYRATNDENDGGISWTLSEKYAEWYKEVYNKSMILTKIIHKNDVFALIERNNEEEIIYL
jgi:hypothetical protein